MKKIVYALKNAVIYKKPHFFDREKMRSLLTKRGMRATIEKRKK